jgi:hypothetical protein
MPGTVPHAMDITTHKTRQKLSLWHTLHINSSHLAWRRRKEEDWHFGRL